MNEIMQKSILEIKSDLLKEIFNLIPEEEKTKEGTENGFEIQFEVGKDGYKISYKILEEKTLESRFYIPKNKKMEEIEKLDILFIYKQALMDELKKDGMDYAVAKQILEEGRRRVKERAELNLYKLDAETEV